LLNARRPIRRAVIRLLTTLLAAACVAGAQAAAQAQAQDYYVIALSHLDNKVSEIDPRTGRTLRAFVVPGEWYGEVHEAAITPDQRTLFVSVPYAKRVIVLDLETFTQKGTIESEYFSRPAEVRGFARIGKRESTSGDPHGLALNPDATKLYITVEFAEVPGIVVFDVKAGKVVRKIDTVVAGNYLWVHPRNGKLYFPTRDDRVVVVDTKTDAILRVVRLHAGSRPNGVDFGGPAGEVWINGDGDGSVTVLDAATDQVLKVIRPRTKGMGRVAVSPDGRHAAATQGRDVSVIDTRTREIVATLPISPDESGHGFPLFSPDSATLHVINETSDDMVSFDMKTMTQAGGRVPVGGASFGGAVRMVRR
jgi:DNA-binding beta-propeller fold protein YncE